MGVVFVMALAPPLFAACLWDVRHRLIPDWASAWIAAVGLAAAVVAASLAGEPATLIAPMASGLACLGLGALAARTGLWGWGDAKLLGAAGLVVGPEGLLPLLLGTALAGGGLALLLLALRGPVRRGALALPPGAPRWLRAEQTRLRRYPTIPYAVAIATGLATALLKA